jgi:ribosomal protein L32
MKIEQAIKAIIYANPGFYKNMILRGHVCMYCSFVKSTNSDI